MHRSLCGLFVLVVVAVAARPLPAQRASPWLPPDHWSRVVLARMHAAGLHGLDPAVAVRPVDEAFAALSPPYRARLAEEWLRPGEGPPATVRVESGLFLDTRRDVLRPGGFDLERRWRDPRRLPDRTTPGVRLRAEAVPFQWLALDTEIEATEEAVRVEQAAVGVALGGIGLWAGRRRHGYDPADGGGFVLNALGRFDGAGLHTLRPFALPLLGPLTGEIFAGPTPRNGHVERPWLLAMRVHLRPHARLDFGATRAAVFGRLGGGTAGLGAVAGVLIGTNLSGDHADDQVASVDIRWRPPLSFPLEFHAEWGMHDIDPGVLVDVPAITIGVRLPDPTGTGRL